MKTALVIAVLAVAACKPSTPAAETAAPPAESPVEKNRVEKYVGALQADVKRAQEAKEKADAASKKAVEAMKQTE